MPSHAETVVLLTTWNRPALLRQSLPQIEREAARIGASLVICDDQSTDAETLGLLHAASTRGADLIRRQYVRAGHGGLEESVEGNPRVLHGRFVDLFDPELRLQSDVSIDPGSRRLLLDLDAARIGRSHVLASACKALPKEETPGQISFTVEGVGETPAIMLLESIKAPRTVTLAGKSLATFEYSAKERLLWIRFANDVVPRELVVHY